MYLIMNYNSEVIYHISETAERINDQNIKVNNGTLILGSADKLPIIEVDSVPAEVEAQKYCYSESKGFYVNPDYVEPVPEPTMQDLQKKISELTANLEYMTMMSSIELPNDSTETEEVH